MTDIFGDIVDATTVEDAVKATLQAWLPDHLAHQERRKSLPDRTLPQPRSWPTLNEFMLQAHEQLPAVVIVSPGTLRHERREKGVYRVAWRIDVGVGIAGKNETEARLLASLYLAAIKGALAQARNLDGAVNRCQWVGPDVHAVEDVERGAQRAFHATTFEVTVDNALTDSRPLSEPSEDPYNPGDAPPEPDSVEIVIEASLEDTP